MTNIGEQIKKIRKEKGLSQKDLGKLLGVSQQMVGQYESPNANLQQDTINKIADALGVPEYELRGFDGSIRVKITPELMEIDRIANKIRNDRENVTEEEYKIIYDYYNSGQFKEHLKHTSQITKEFVDLLKRNFAIKPDLSESGDFSSDNLDKMYGDPLSYEHSYSYASSEEEYEERLRQRQKQGEDFLLSDYRKLNDIGQAEARKRVNELTEIRKYTEKNNYP